MIVCGDYGRGNQANRHIPSYISCCHAFSLIGDFELTEQHKVPVRTGIECIPSANSPNATNHEKTAKIDDWTIRTSQSINSPPSPGINPLPRRLSSVFLTG
jgi:hypothetical protein